MPTAAATDQLRDAARALARVVEYAAWLPVPLTTMRQPVREIGEAAVAAMLERRAHPERRSASSARGPRPHPAPPRVSHSRKASANAEA